MDPKEPVVITCGIFHAGTDASINPEHAEFKVDIHTFSEEVQREAVAAVNSRHPERM